MTTGLRLRPIKLWSHNQAKRVIRRLLREDPFRRDELVHTSYRLFNHNVFMVVLF